MTLGLDRNCGVDLRVADASTGLGRDGSAPSFRDCQAEGGLRAGSTARHRAICLLNEGEAGEVTSPRGLGERTARISRFRRSAHGCVTPSMHAPSSGSDCVLTHAQWCAQHSVSRAAFSAAFVPVAAAAASSRLGRSNNSCWLGHGHPGCGGTKTLSTSTGSRVWRSPAGNDCAPVLSHSPRGTSEDLHGRAGVRVVSLPGDPFPWIRLGSTWLSEGDSRGVNVSRMLDTVVPGPGCRRRAQIGWEVLLRDHLAGGAWGVGDASGSCTYSYGGRVHSPDKCDAARSVLAFIWRGIAPLMRPWCWAEDEMPGGVNLNLYSDGKACIPRHSDNEPLFGGGGDSKLIVSVSFGATATFRWAPNSDRDGSSGFVPEAFPR